MDPLEQLSISERVQMRWRMWRAWRQGRAERDARTLGRLSSLEGNDLVLSTQPAPEGSLSVGEVAFSSGTTVRLAPCSRAVLRRLGELASDQVAVLDRAANHGRFWGLYFSVAGQRIGVLCREITVIGGSGGLRVPRSPSLLPV